jgi:hypothetical protein
MRIRAGLLAAALAALVLAQPAEAKLTHGVHAANALSAAEVERMGQGDVGVLRVIFRWSQIEPAKTSSPTYDWRRYDPLIRAAGKERLTVLPIIVGTPDWAPHVGEGWPEDPESLAHYQAFLQAVLRRYGRRGDFWDENPELRHTPIKDLQIWNEPNRPLFSPGGDVAPKKYAAFLKLSDRVIKGVDRKARTVIAGMPERTTTSRPLYKYLRQMYEVRKVEKAFDVMCLHPYGRDEEGVEGAITRMRRFLKKHDNAKRELWITEVGWGSGGASSDFTKTPEKQASLLQKTFKLLGKKQKKYRLGSVIWFSWRDRHDPGSTGQWQDHTGLFKRDGGRKPAWEAFVRFTGGSPGRGPLPGGIGIPLRAPQVGPPTEVVPSSPAS